MLRGADIVTCVPSPGQAGAALLSLPGSGSDVTKENEANNNRDKEGRLREGFKKKV